MRRAKNDSNKRDGATNRLSFMATDTSLLSPMMCMALWATKHEVKHCVSGKTLDDCPLVEVVNCKDCKYNDEGTCYIDGLGVCDDYFERKE